MEIFPVKSIADFGMVFKRLSIELSVVLKFSLEPTIISFASVLKSVSRIFKNFENAGIKVLRPLCFFMFPMKIIELSFWISLLFSLKNSGRAE